MSTKINARDRITYVPKSTGMAVYTFRATPAEVAAADADADAEARARRTQRCLEIKNETGIELLPGMTIDEARNICLDAAKHRNPADVASAVKAYRAFAGIMLKDAHTTITQGLEQ